MDTSIKIILDNPDTSEKEKDRLLMAHVAESIGSIHRELILVRQAINKVVTDGAEIHVRSREL